MNKLAALLSAFFAVMASAARVTHKDLDNYTFDRFVSDFGLKYEPSEIEHRRALFLEELARVKAHNFQNLSWKEGINKFSAMSKDEKMVFTGRNKRAAATHSTALKSVKSLPKDFVMKPVADLPTTVDWREKDVVSSVKDQGHCGSCWAFASTATLESHVAINSGLLFSLSTEQIAMCAPNDNHCGGTGKCEGSTAELAYEWAAQSHGIYQEYQYPYISYTGTDYDCAVPGLTKPVAAIDGYVQLKNNNYQELMNAIAQIGPIAINIDASTWHAYESGVFNGCNQEVMDINHVVVAVGYGTDASTGSDYWLVRNSWSPNYGEQGYIRLLRTKNEDENCATDYTPQDGVVCEDKKDVAIKVCGTCGIIYDSVYPTGARAL